MPVKSRLAGARASGCGGAGRRGDSLSGTVPTPSRKSGLRVSGGASPSPRPDIYGLYIIIVCYSYGIGRAPGRDPAPGTAPGSVRVTSHRSSRTASLIGLGASGRLGPSGGRRRHLNIQRDQSPCLGSRGVRAGTQGGHVRSESAGRLRRGCNKARHYGRVELRK